MRSRLDPFIQLTLSSVIKSDHEQVAERMFGFPTFLMQRQHLIRRKRGTSQLEAGPSAKAVDRVRKRITVTWQDLLKDGRSE